MSGQSVPRPGSSGKHNKLCELGDWEQPRLADAMRRVLPYFAATYREYPRGFEHRKHWEYAQVVSGLELLGAVHAVP